MLVSALAFCAMVAKPAAPNIVRDGYGVPHIAAANWDQAIHDQAYAVAQDRLWQMEISRRLARGQMSEAFGQKYVQSDREVLTSSYTDEEIDRQFDALSASTRSAVESYVSGVNDYIKDAESSHSLPQEYAANQLEPRPWTKEDSLAITIRLLQLFGRGGAGELRNLAVVSYLKLQPNAKNRITDILDDFLWQNDRSALTTLSPADDPQASNPPLVVRFTRKQTEDELARYSDIGLFDLVPALQLAETETSRRVAAQLGVPFRTGSYCVVVEPKRSAIAAPLLMSGPQMGFSSPAIIHEVALSVPGTKVAGIDIPGVPGVIIGMTPNFSWGLTTGVADTEDIYSFKTKGARSYVYDGRSYPLQVINRNLKVKGAPDQTVEEDRTMYGPVLLHTHDLYFSQRSAFAGAELKSLDAFFGLYNAKTAQEVDRTVQGVTLNFNFFFAMTDGDCGWRYLGKIPIRPVGIDPRFPLPAAPRNAWTGFLNPAQMPHVINPKAGYLANWNNKPTVWWPNYDTPTWGRIFRNEVLVEQISKMQLSASDLEQAAWSIARLDETTPYFMPYAKQISTQSESALNDEALHYLKAFDGRKVDGSISATLYNYWFTFLRSELFVGTTGNFVSPGLFALAAQPSVMLKAIQGKTTVNYLGKRTARQVAEAAFKDAVQQLLKERGSDIATWAYRAQGIAVQGETPIPYSNRGSYIQIATMLPHPFGRNVLSPGEAESGEHSEDQVPLARAWLFKPFGP